MSAGCWTRPQTKAHREASSRRFTEQQTDAQWDRGPTGGHLQEGSLPSPWGSPQGAPARGGRALFPTGAAPQGPSLGQTPPEPVQDRTLGATDADRPQGPRRAHRLTSAQTPH